MIASFWHYVSINNRFTAAGVRPSPSLLPTGEDHPIRPSLKALWCSGSQKWGRVSVGVSSVLMRGPRAQRAGVGPDELEGEQCVLGSLSQEEQGLGTGLDSDPSHPLGPQAMHFVFSGLGYNGKNEALLILKRVWEGQIMVNKPREIN